MQFKIELFFKDKYRKIKLVNINPLKKKNIEALVLCPNTEAHKIQYKKNFKYF